MSAKKCNVCECDFNIESEGGVEGNFGVLEVAFCPTCYVCMCDMVNDGRQWVELTDEGMKALVDQAREVPVEVPCPDYNERLLTLANNKLRELNA